MVAFLVGFISLGARIFGAEHPHDFPRRSRAAW